MQQQKDAKAAIADFEAKNKLKKTEDSNADDDNDNNNNDEDSSPPVISAPAPSSTSSSSSSSHKHGPRFDGSPFAIPAFVLGIVASAAVVYLAQNTKN